MIYDHLFELFQLIGYLRIYLGLFQPTYAEAADPNYIPLVHDSRTRQTYEELKVSQSNLDTNECTHIADSVLIDLPNEGYTNLAEKNPYVNAP